MKEKKTEIIRATKEEKQMLEFLRVYRVNPQVVLNEIMYLKKQGEKEKGKC
jgi:arginine exporter protein ArgO